MILHLLSWLLVLVIAFLAGKLVSKLKLPAILGWLIAGMLLGPHAASLLSQDVLDASWYKTIIIWMQCAFGLMLGTELVWNRIKNYGKALIVTTLTQSLGTFALVSLVFGIHCGHHGKKRIRNGRGNKLKNGSVRQQLPQYIIHLKYCKWAEASGCFCPLHVSFFHYFFLLPKYYLFTGTNFARFISGCCSVIAPGFGQAITQAPQ